MESEDQEPEDVLNPSSASFHTGMEKAAAEKEDTNLQEAIESLREAIEEPNATDAAKAATKAAEGEETSGKRQKMNLPNMLMQDGEGSVVYRCFYCNSLSYLFQEGKATASQGFLASE